MGRMACVCARNRILVARVVGKQKPHLTVVGWGARGVGAWLCADVCSLSGFVGYRIMFLCVV
jgi:hypothetical protein